MQYISLLLNIPWTAIGILQSLVSFPRKIDFSRKPMAIIFYVRSFWWYTWFPGQKSARGMAMGNVVLLGPLEEEGDREHELVHVEQFEREPLIHILLSAIEQMKNGYRHSKYEVEAYNRAGNKYYEKGKRPD